MPYFPLALSHFLLVESAVHVARRDVGRDHGKGRAAKQRPMIEGIERCGPGLLLLQ
jgi:hypothetical protein